MKILTATNDNLISLSILLLRLMSGLVLFVAGAGKALGWFGGFGMEITVQMFDSHMGIPAWLAYLSTYTELIGGILLIAGFLTRLAALALTINMLVAVILVGPKDFFTPNGGVFPCLVLICALAVLITGPMKYSIDYLMTGGKRTTSHANSNSHGGNIQD